LRWSVVAGAKSPELTEGLDECHRLRTFCLSARSMSASTVVPLRFRWALDPTLTTYPVRPCLLSPPGTRRPRTSRSALTLSFDAPRRTVAQCLQSHSRPFFEDVLPSSTFSHHSIASRSSCLPSFPLLTFGRPITFRFDLPRRCQGRHCDRTGDVRF